MNLSKRPGSRLAMRTLDAHGQLISDERRAKNYLRSLPGMTARQLKRHRRAGRALRICECAVCRELPLEFRQTNLDTMLEHRENAKKEAAEHQAKLMFGAPRVPAKPQLSHL